MPADQTKTKIDYFWLLPNEMNQYVDLIHKLEKTGFESSE